MLLRLNPAEPRSVRGRGAPTIGAPFPDDVVYMALHYVRLADSKLSTRRSVSIECLC